MISSGQGWHLGPVGSLDVREPDWFCAATVDVRYGNFGTELSWREGVYRLRGCVGCSQEINENVGLIAVLLRRVGSSTGFEVSTRLAVPHAGCSQYGLSSVVPCRLDLNSMYASSISRGII